MKTLSPNLQALLGQAVHTLTTCWRIERADGQIFGFTEHDRDLVVDGVTYLAASGYNATSVQQNSELKVDNLELAGFFDSEAITEEDLRLGKYDMAWVEIFMVDFVQPWSGTIPLSRGTIGRTKRGRFSYVAEFRGLGQQLQQTVGRLCTPSCDADLGDSRCTVILATYTVSGFVTATSDEQTFQDTANRTEEDDEFKGGKLIWTSGLNATRSIEVRAWTQADRQFVLAEKMPFAIVEGDQYEVHSGCDKSVGRCGTKFSNIVNFRGFPHVPGTDQMLKYPNSHN